MEKRHILLTTDLSEEATRAFGPVCELARLVEARITLLYVVQVLTKVPQGAMLAQPVTLGNPEAETEEAKKALSEQRKLLDADLDVTEAVVLNDDIAAGVNEYARQHEVGMIALSTHGRSGLRRFVLGSVAEAVLRHAVVPVVSFPPAPE